MAQHPWLDPRPFTFGEGEKVGVLLIHGFTGAPAEMRPMGEYLAAQGYTVTGPQLAGHGSRWQTLNRMHWQDWVSSAGVALTQLQAHCDRVFVGGLSLGGLITLYLGAQHPEIDGLVPMAPAMSVRNKLIYLTPLLKYLFKKRDIRDTASDAVDPATFDRCWSYPVTPIAAAHEVLKLQRRVWGLLEQVTQPLLIFQGYHDRQVNLKGTARLYERVRAADKALVWLDNSGHCLTVDSERQAVWRKTHEWIQGRSH
jgi:carboxylesterase